MYRTKTKITKTCELCGKEFVTNKAARHICFDDHYKTCAVCGKEFLIDWNSRNKQTCSKECMKIQMSKKLSSDEVREKTIATNLEKYGVEAPLQSDKIKEQMKEHTMEKYGVEHTSKLQSTQEQRKKTTLERYGVECVLQSEEVKEKIKETNLDRYGSENVSSNEDIKNKKSETLMKHYGVDNPMKSEEIQNRVIQTNLDKYGVPYASQAKSVQDNIKKTNQKRYSCDYVFQSPKIKKKIDVTNLERYGTVYPSQNEDIKKKTQNTVTEKYGGFTYQSEELMKKVKTTNIKKFGTEYPSQSEEIKNKVKNTSQNKYGVDYVFQADEVKESIRETCLQKYGVDWNCMRKEARAHKTISHVNEEFAKVLYRYGIKYEMEFVLKNRSYDFRILNTNILIEINPTITHNSFMSIFDKDSNGIDKKYHLNKSILAEENGYRCIHIFDWEDWDSIISIILENEIIYARKCSLKEIDVHTACVFEEENHIQGKCKGQLRCYGLYNNGELVEVMTFGKARYNKNFQWEILRLCTKTGISVVGGASRLFKQFITDTKPESIISYCNRSKFDGSVYKQIGMELYKSTIPNKIWSKQKEYITHNFLLQRGYDQIFDTDFGKGTSNEELMLSTGWLPVYDCGQLVFTWQNNST